MTSEKLSWPETVLQSDLEVKITPRNISQALSCTVETLTDEELLRMNLTEFIKVKLKTNYTSVFIAYNLFVYIFEKSVSWNVKLLLLLAVPVYTVLPTTTLMVMCQDLNL